MPIMLKIRWEIAEGRENDFRQNQQKLCAVMHDDHPGVICYHVDYPSPGVSEWVEIYANDDVFKAHLANEKGKGPLTTLVGACAKITCRCWGIRTRDRGRFSRASAPPTTTPPRRPSRCIRGPTGLRASERPLRVPARAD